LQKTCCQSREIYLTPADRARIEAHTGRRDFARFAVAAPEYLEQDDDPEWLVIFRPDGSRRVLARREDGDCTFLGPTGCGLPLEVRPLICRLYPFDYTAAGLRDELSEGCPTQLLAPGQRLLRVLDMDRQVAEGWRAQLYAELALETTDADRPDLRPQV
jgi:Fe-S-cluster containining protein